MFKSISPFSGMLKFAPQKKKQALARRACSSVVGLAHSRGRGDDWNRAPQQPNQPDGRDDEWDIPRGKDGRGPALRGQERRERPACRADPDPPTRVPHASAQHEPLEGSQHDAEQYEREGPGCPRGRRPRWL